jgi:hypothetical protein
MLPYYGVANVLNVGADFLNDFFMSVLAGEGVDSEIHFINTDNQLLHI